MMTGMKTLREWMEILGYEWVAGREGLIKGTTDFANAQDIIDQLHREGSVRKNG